MSKFRFKPEDFGPFPQSNQYPVISVDQAVKTANAILEAEEAKCERVYADCRPVHRKWYDDKTGMGGKFGIQALLWNVEEIGE